MILSYEKEQLLELDSTRNRETFARVTSLDRYERPVETIEGKITSGSISIDGNSSVRRSCSVSLVAKDVTIHNIYWGLQSKIKVEVGVRNLLKGPQSPIFWFKQGIYVLTEFRVQQSVNNFTISLSGKDKMCLLNGEVGGHFMAQTDLGQIENIAEDGTITLTPIPIKTIVKEMLVGIGNELPQNIILNNIDDYAAEMLVYTGDEPMYIYIATEGEQINEGIDYVMPDDGAEWERLNGHDDEISSASILSVIDFHNPNATSGQYTEEHGDGDIKCAVFKVLKNHVCGYRITDLTYPGGELIANIGETITSILDKIKNQFGTFEYFYDIDGHFVFQRKQLYTNSSYNTRTDYTLEDTESYVENPYKLQKYIYYFNNNNLLTAINNTPNLGNLKKDYTIWGENSNQLAIHLRYAIDIKPTEYKTYDGVYYSTGQMDEQTLEDLNEIVRQAQSYKKELDNSDPEYLGVKQQLSAKQKQYSELLGKQESGQELTEEDLANLASLPGEIDNLERRRIELEGENGEGGLIQECKDAKMELFRTCCDWRELIYQMALDWFQYYHNGGQTDDEHNTADTFILKLQENNPNNENLLLHGRTGYEQYYTDLQGFWRYLYDPSAIDEDGNYDIITGYNKLIDSDWESLLFYFDFLDADGSEVGAYAIPYIGDRTKTSNNHAIKVIKYEEVPNLLYFWNDIDLKEESAKRIAEGYHTIWFTQSDMENYADIAARNRSCYDELDELINNYTYINQSISLTSIPILYLEPNTLIYIKDETNDINGEYSINRMTIPLTYNGTMSITANRVPQRLY